MFKCKQIDFKMNFALKPKFTPWLEGKGSITFKTLESQGSRMHDNTQVKWTKTSG